METEAGSVNIRRSKASTVEEFQACTYMPCIFELRFKLKRRGLSADDICGFNNSEPEILSVG